ncbi:Gfo/Idh/MocA family protein [Calycomorphotria hydatis]|uniref:Putative oxidoreductase YcjS n=1 Tax=Calycomorphotria hydatis TaxID=2528027 RepID=A0A517T9T2_9PLAN|nr:Gfo/Idh/MocA family oxidoreductase [Calycomorphotria hydatis]QDT65123.1 putative oxidoreductase YcjS [Calycomorphotria hydatis]
MSDAPLKVLCVGAGHMGRSHALAYQSIQGYEITGLCTRTPQSRASLIKELGQSIPEFNDYDTALRETQPDVVSISTYTETHYPYAMAALEQGCHLFVEKPIAETVEQAEEIFRIAKERKRKIVVGYILRHNPMWNDFIDIARTLGKPLVMRMNLNQQSSGAEWETHRKLMSVVSPIVDCGVHYVDVMCQMTQAVPVRVSSIGARLTEELPEGMVNYGQLQVAFDDGSVGWYEAGWGPMMSETAFFVKDVVGPKGCVSIRAEQSSAEGNSSNVDSHTQAEALRIHSSEINEQGNFVNEDEIRVAEDELSHDQLCVREQEYLLNAIQNDEDLESHWKDAINSMRIVMAADESFRSGKTINL